jgi:hypothetical protein
MATKEIIEFPITQGPSREDARDSLGSRKQQILEVRFTVELTPEQCERLLMHVESHAVIVATINALEWEDSERMGMNLKCQGLRITFGTQTKEIPMLHPFTAYYHPGNRTGLMKFELAR